MKKIPKRVKDSKIYAGLKSSMGWKSVKPLFVSLEELNIDLISLKSSGCKGTFYDNDFRFWCLGTGKSLESGNLLNFYAEWSPSQEMYNLLQRRFDLTKLEVSNA